MKNRLLNDGKSSIPLNKNQKVIIKKLEELLNESDNIVSSACLCGNNDFNEKFLSDGGDVIAKKEHMGIPITTVLCEKCGLIMQKPHMSAKLINQYYTGFYPILYSTISGKEKEFSEMEVRGNRVYEIVRKSIVGFDDSPRKILEIGCNMGGILKPFFGHDCHGIDLDPESIKFAVHKGISAECMSVYEYREKNPNVQFDLVILNHVLEHMGNLKQELAEIGKLIKPSGHLYIGVPSLFSTLPNVQWDILRHLESDHIYYFTEETLELVMDMCGYHQEYIEDRHRHHISAVYSKINGMDKQKAFTNQYSKVRDFLMAAENNHHKRRHIYMCINNIKHFLPLNLKVAIKRLLSKA